MQTINKIKRKAVIYLAPSTFSDVKTPLEWVRLRDPPLLSNSRLRDPIAKQQSSA